jgi:hypothetical protein
MCIPNAPSMTKSIQSALNDLKLEKMWVVYPGDKRYFIDEKVEVLPFNEIPDRWEYKKMQSGS